MPSGAWSARAMIAIAAAGTAVVFGVTTILA
jgi:hypothetical protein